MSHDFPGLTLPENDLARGETGGVGLGGQDSLLENGTNSQDLLLFRVLMAFATTSLRRLRGGLGRKIKFKGNVVLPGASRGQRFNIFLVL